MEAPFQYEQRELALPVTCKCFIILDRRKMQALTEGRGSIKIT
jgi:hypothetical protein